MSSRTGTLTALVGACALASLPVFVSGQTPANPHPRPPASGRHQTADHSSPQHHLQQAKRALDSINMTTLKGEANTQVAEIRRHLKDLESGWQLQQSTPAREAVVPPGHATGHVTGTTGTTTTGEWMTHYRAIGQILDRVLGSTGKASTDMTFDAATRSKLADFRKHLNAFHATVMTTQPARGSATRGAADVPDATPSERTTPGAIGTSGAAAAPDATIAARRSAAVDDAVIARLRSEIGDMMRADPSTGSNTVCVDRAKLEQLARDLDALNDAR
jgi:hypothetical protein